MSKAPWQLKMMLCVPRYERLFYHFWSSSGSRDPDRNADENSGAYTKHTDKMYMYLYKYEIKIIL